MPNLQWDLHTLPAVSDVFIYLLGHACGMWKFWGQGQNLYHKSDNPRILNLLSHWRIPLLDIFNPSELIQAQMKSCQQQREEKQTWDS